MPRTLYGLLVAIDQYLPPVPALSGCGNDIDAIREFLEQFGADGGFTLDLEVLKDAGATRGAVVDGFRRHLSKAGPEDVALFYYSGHGSQEEAPPEFWHLEPDRLNETLVCHDSRGPGGWDLADKELAVLIAQVARRDPHILCILDCCHSGSGTRAALEEGTAVRRAPTDRRHRPMETFLDGALAAAVGRRDDAPRGNWGVTPTGRHLLMAACRPDETAKEIRLSGKAHGAFTTALLAALRLTQGSTTYRDLLKRAEAQVRLRVSQQIPQLEASNASDLHRSFLGGAVGRQRAHFTLRRDKQLGWVIDGGAVHGIAHPARDETTVLAIFDLEAAPADWRHLDRALALAEIDEVRPNQSHVRLQVRSGELDQEGTYRALVIASPLPALGVFLDGEPHAVERVRQAIARGGDAGGHSTFVREVSSEDDAEFRLNARAGSYRIRQAKADRLLVSEIVDPGEEGANAVIHRLEHIARWQVVTRLNNPGSRLGLAPVEIALFLTQDDGEGWHEADPRREARLEYRNVGGVWHQPQVRIEVRNTGREDIYCAVLWLGEDYSISSELIPGGTVHLPAGRSVALNNGEPVWGFVPDEQWRAGRTEVHDLLKLIVSTEQFDATLFDQGQLDRYTATRHAEVIRRTPMNALERLAARVHHRALSTKPAGGEILLDWATSTVALSVVRPLDAAQVPAVGKTQDLGAGVTLVGHPSLRAKARLASPTETGRDLGHLGMPASLRDDPNSSQPFLFEAPRGGDPGLGSLQLTDIENPAAVTADSPLVLRVQAQLRPGEHILPFAWDGEFFLPLGVGRPANEGIEIELRQLPEPLRTTRDVERGVVSSVRILFQKILSSKFGTDYDYPRLAAVSFDAQGLPAYETDSEAVFAKVKQANRVLLYVHGILGDTLGMTASSQVILPDAPSRHVGGSYDLILAFDYENIQTGIKETARKLGERLAKVGLGSGHGKVLDVAAHSMGGLVSRWFIEREGGNQVVRRLVTLGTPHAGSPWPKIQDWATAALTIGLNGLTQIAWPVKVLGDLLGAIETVDVMLDEMAPTSSFLTELGASADPAIPYTLLVGNTSIIPQAMSGDIVQRLLARLAPQRMLHAATSLVFLRAPNDIAVSVVSAQAVPISRVPAPHIVEVPCDHVTFFSSSAGQRALFEALQRA